MAWISPDDIVLISISPPFTVPQALQ